MKTINLIMVFIVLMCMSINTLAQIKIDHNRYKNYLINNESDRLLEETLKIRKSKEYGKNWIIDYYIALGFCSAGRIGISNKAFNYILDEYPKNTKIVNLVKDSKNSCSNASASYQLVKIQNLFASNNGQGGGTEHPITVVKGKLGYVLNCNRNIELYEFKLDFKQEELQNRLFEIDEVDLALSYYNNFLEYNYNVQTSGRYIFVTPLNKTLNDKDIRKATNELEKVYNFYTNYFSIRPPDKLITVYLMESPSKLSEIALITHGLVIPKNNYGYSCLADLSVLGNSSPSRLGTIKHELFHLMVRTDIGDIPGWLDEGIACLYEESHWENNKLVPNGVLWRTAVLKTNDKTKNPLPSIRTIIENNWSEFTPSSAKTICELSVSYALTKHFIMYLEEKDLLTHVVDKFKNRKNIFVDTTYHNESSIAILEEALGDTLPNIQSDFDNWLMYEFGINTNRDPKELSRRIERLYEGLEMECYGNDEVSALREEYQILMDRLGLENVEIRGALLDRCTKFIYDVEELALECAHLTGVH